MRQIEILYVGDEGAAVFAAAVEPLGWWVHMPESLYEALAQYVFNYPHVVVLCGEGWIDEVEMHITSLEDGVPCIRIGGAAGTGEIIALVQAALNVVVVAG